MLKHRIVLVGLTAAALAFACNQAKDDTAPDGGANGPDGGASAEGGASTDPDAGGPLTEGGSTLPGAVTTCPDGKLYAGNPYFDGDLEGWVTAGQEKLADPPLPTRRLAVAGQTVFYGMDSDVWRTDGTKIARLAGDASEGSPKYKPTGSCADARFIEIRGVATLPNGNALVIDAKGGGIVELATPTGACTASAYAGNGATTLEADITTDVANQGDVDGAGNQAKFFGLEHITTDAQGNVYIADTGNHKIKKIGNDAAHTVTTLYKFPTTDDPLLLSMTVLKGKLYVAGATVPADFLWEIDTQTGAQKQIYSGRDIFPGVDSSELAIIVGLTNDGTSLIAGSNKGFLFRVDTTGKATQLAGAGSFADYPTGIDATKTLAAKDIPLKAINTNEGSIALLGSTILWAGRNGIGWHVMSVRCQ